MNLESQPDKRHTLLGGGDAEGEAPTGGWTTVLWSSFGKAFNRNVVSMREPGERGRPQYHPLVMVKLLVW